MCRPIVKPEDLKGIKLRVPGGVWRVKMFKDYGANPSPMPLAEVYSALQSGVMDAQENPFPQIASAKFHEVQKFLSLTGHVYTPAYLVVGRRVVGEAAERRAGRVGEDRLGHGGFRPLARASGWIRNSLANLSRRCGSTRLTKRRSSKARRRFTKNSARKSPAAVISSSSSSRCADTSRISYCKFHISEAAYCEI